MWIVLKGSALRAAFASALLFGAALVSVACLVPRAQPALSAAGDAPTVWIIDAGHGGEDGGAVAADGTKESDVNLAVAQRLASLLALLGEDARMTRTSDHSLHDDAAATLRQKKRSDLAYRVALVNETSGAVLVSLHQNSLPSSSRVRGAQVFFGGQEGSDTLAQAIQRSLNAHINPGNEKSEKRIDASIYLMKNVSAPAVLIECGFLSNAAETELLKSGSYQTCLALAIVEGLLSQ